ncbi:hypothetical protein [uncultured Cellulomonas sp.]|uniref:hypothetical protein n=1 Tax=uncultured Cellulomonas sp. TaxID=189682 RepID=UPI0028EF7C4D|nr:hypothetical protein [uncultured Cellulomonas sp.]
MRRSLVIVLAAVLPVAALVGCTPSDPAPSPTATSAAPTATPTPTLDAEELAEQQNIADATAALHEFNDLDNAAAQAGYGDWTSLGGHLSGDFLPAMIAAYEDYGRSGWRTTGPVELVGTEVAEYRPDPVGTGTEVVLLDTCIDISQADLVDAAGTSVVAPPEHDRYLVTYTMFHQDDGRWTVHAAEPHTDQPC